MEVGSIHKSINKGSIIILMLAIVLGACQNEIPERPSGDYVDYTPDPVNNEVHLSNIDFSNWKVTLPIPRSDGKPLEVSPPDILSFSTNETLKPFMYNDSTDGSVVFYTYPGVTTTNTSYSRTELREQMVPGSNSVNWTFAEGGKMVGTLSVPEISKNDDGDFHRTMIMQIHGRLTDQQRNLIGQSDNNAPPVLKVFWRDNKVYVRTKQLKDTTTTYEQMLDKDAWEDDDGKYFARTVGTDTFKLEVVASDGKMTVTLDDSETFVYEGVHMRYWGIFENYFKAGNYLQTTDAGAFARVKYYNLEVSHD